MEQKRSELFSHLGTTREFLLNKTESRTGTNRWGNISDDTLSMVLKTFPELHYGSTFIDTAMELLHDTPKFSAMAIRIDDEKTGESTSDVFTGIDVLKALDVLCRGKRATWGIMGEAVLGAFFPDLDHRACLSLSQSLQYNLATAGSETVTIGIAAYPTLDYEKSQILDAAGKALDHAMFFGPNSAVAFDAVSLNISGDNRYQEGDIKGAIEEYRQALKLDPSNVNVHNSLGVCHGVLKHYKKALSSFQAAIELDSKEVMAIYNIGLIHMMKNNRKKALENFMKAYDISQDVFEIGFHIGKCHLDAGHYETATEYLEKAAVLQPDSPPLLSCLGQCYAALKIHDKAVRAFQTAIKKNPNDAEALSGLGHLFDIQNENPEIATVFCEQSVTISPDNGLFHHRLGRLYFKQNRLDDAMKSFITANDLGYDSKTFLQDIERRLSEPSAF
jgi:tetratricopeptide (TPR) repeat protein